jgi:hypothetical protein
VQNMSDLGSTFPLSLVANRQDPGFSSNTTHSNKGQVANGMHCSQFLHWKCRDNKDIWKYLEKHTCAFFCLRSCLLSTNYNQVLRYKDAWDPVLAFKKAHNTCVVESEG